MNTSFKLSILGAFFLLVPFVSAEKTQNIQRGGLGLVFPDHNRFANLGQTAQTKGASVEANYMTTSSAVGNIQAAIPSFMYSNGTFGFGVFGSRGGTSFTDSTLYTDVVGGGLGVGVVKDKLNIGASYSRSLATTTTDQGNLDATLTWHAGKLGPVITANYGMVLSNTSAATPSNSAKLGIGFNLSSMVTFEAIGTLANLSDFNNWQAGAVINYMAKFFYLSSRYDYLRSSSSSQLQGRIGFILGKFDLSAFASYLLVTGSNPTLGGSLRVTF